MIDALSKLLIFMALVAAILVAGWKQPLRYRFMSPAQVYAIEHPAPPPKATPAAWMQDPTRRTLLDGGPYSGRRVTRGAVLYDPRLSTPYPSPYR